MLATIEKCAVKNKTLNATLDHLNLIYDEPGILFDKTVVQSRLKMYKKAAGPGPVPFTVQLLTQLNQRPYTLKTEDKGWYYDAAYDHDNRLDRLFWMNPEQRNLYERYHDVV
ncbi:hypothetical protein BGX28_002450, partial [Mortierella sp. GBA30]